MASIVLLLSMMPGNSMKEPGSTFRLMQNLTTIIFIETNLSIKSHWLAYELLKIVIKTSFSSFHEIIKTLL